MAGPLIRLVIDTNTVLRGLARPLSASGRIVSAADQRTLLLLTSKRVLAEYRLILSDVRIMTRHPALSPRAVEASIRRLVYVSDYVDPIHVRFDFPRDRRDEKFLELAIAGKATHLVTFDPDLLSLSSSHSDAAKRLRRRMPKLRILLPADFLRENAASLQGPS